VSKDRTTAYLGTVQIVRNEGRDPDYPIDVSLYVSTGDDGTTTLEFASLDGDVVCVLPAYVAHFLKASL